LVSGKQRGKKHRKIEGGWKGSRVGNHLREKVSSSKYVRREWERTRVITKEIRGFKKPLLDGRQVVGNRRAKEKRNRVSWGEGTWTSKRHMA